MISKDILAKKQQNNISEKKVNFSDWNFQLFLKGKKMLKRQQRQLPTGVRRGNFLM